MPTESDCDLDAFDAGQATSLVEILSLHHFIQMYDQYQIDDDEMNCAADVSAAMKDDDAVSVISVATLDSSAAPTRCYTNKKENIILASLASSLTIENSNSTIDEVQLSSIKSQGKKKIANLSKRIIRTAKREAKKAHFNCEVVEC